jgi:hypothetical protein
MTPFDDRFVFDMISEKFGVIPLVSFSEESNCYYADTLGGVINHED